ncbi:MAG: DUF1080 domain-containing protein, partial [Planctomycetaceae bacterium]
MKPLLCILLLLFASLAHAAERPNVIVFLVDDMGLMDTSVPFLTDVSGKPQVHPLNEFYRTPNMERLAKQGVRLSDFYAMSVCSPTRLSILTGQTSARHRTTNWIKADSDNSGPYGPKWQWKGVTRNHVVLPALLTDAGYASIFVGKAHFGPNGSYGENPTNFGFDVNVGGRAIGMPGSYYGTDDFGRGTATAVHGLEKYHGKDIHLTEALTIEASAEIEKAVRAGKPFFCYLSHYAVHAPFQADKRFAANYTGESNEPLAAFATLVEGMDKSLGDVLDKVESLGVGEDTLVIFLGDNGTDAPIGPDHEIACAAPLRGKKGTHYEGGMRVPFIAAWAKANPANPHQQRTPIAAGAITNRIGAVYDLLPTILGAAGVDTLEVALDGIDLRPAFDGQRVAKPTREFLMHYPHGHRSSYFTAYRKGEWKIVYHYRTGKDPSKTDPHELMYRARNGGRLPNWPSIEQFNLKADPSESKNLATTEPDKLREMLDAMNDALQRTGALMPLDDDKRTPLKASISSAGNWQSLFDGKTLRGWNGNVESVWRVEDGVIVGGSLEGNPRNEFLATDKVYKNFRLRLEYRLVGTNGFVNGGVQFRSRRTSDPPNEMIGYQADIGAGYSGYLYDESRRKKFVAEADPELVKRIEKPGDWNQYEILAIGNEVKIYLNGQMTVSYRELEEGIAQEGNIALQIHGNCKAEISFRNLQIEELDSADERDHAEKPGDADERPNFVIIMVDDMGYEGVSCFGNPYFKTPEIDRLATEGMRMTDFHSSGNVCSPTRAGLLTGRYQQRAGIEAVIHPARAHPEHRKGLKKSEVTFAELLQSAGYATALIGKWHQGYVHNSEDYHPQNHGFDEFIGYHSGNIDFVSHVGDHNEHDWWHGRKKTKEDGYVT